MTYKVSASKSAPTCRYSQIEVPASTRVGDLHHMLSLAFRISGNVTSIFEIELNFLPWLPQFQRLRLTATILGYTAHRLRNERHIAGEVALDHSLVTLLLLS